MRPRAAATNNDRTGSARPSAPASRTAVSWRAVRLMPRSRSLTDRGLRPAALASSACVSWAPARSCRSNPANSEVACSAMTAAPPPAALSPPAAPRTARKGPVPRLSRPGARTAIPGTRPAPLPGPAAAAPTGARDRPARPAAGAVQPACPRTWSRRPPAPSPAPPCGSPVGRRRDDPTGPRPEQDQRRPERAGRPAAPGTEGVIWPLPCAYRVTLN